MHETDAHDLSDDADYAAASKQGSSSITHSDSSKQSSYNEQEETEIVFVKDNVAIHPAQSAIEGISGRLKLFKQGSSLFMTWIPYKGQSSNARLSARDANLYTIRAVSFSDIHSIRRHTPAIGWQYVIRWHTPAIRFLFFLCITATISHLHHHLLVATCRTTLLRHQSHHHPSQHSHNHTTASRTTTTHLRTAGTYQPPPSNHHLCGH
ncbi:uncharacterized protein LOC143544171 [Bidens hawaiensis]|uniref:uncharacterized protein LOC143544171 n=1 Tax=Bidens hawaiensis TaxID=980011 RepID=UPI00404AB576